jgi:CTP synthase
VEAVEITDHPFFIGIQYHPEYASKVGEPHPLFKALIESARKG